MANNNLIPINIKDLPKLNVLSNTDLIPIETVQGTATILYRDFIIDEAHTTFAATLSASVTNAINLSAAIDSTNATVRSVSATLNSSITALSSSSTTYSNALSSQLTALNATVNTLSANVNALSSTANVNSTNIASLSTTVNSLRTTVTTVTGSQPLHYVLTTSIDPRNTPNTPFFDVPNAIFSLESNKAYRLQYFLFYSKQSAGTVTFTISGTNVLNFISGNIIHSKYINSDSLFGTTSGAMVNTTNAAVISFPNTYPIAAGENQFAQINFAIQTSSTTPSIVVAVSCSAGDVTPLRGSSCTITKLN